MGNVEKKQTEDQFFEVTKKLSMDTAKKRKNNMKYTDVLKSSGIDQMQTR